MNNYLSRLNTFRTEVFTLRCLGCVLLTTPPLFALLYIMAAEGCVVLARPSSMSALAALEFGGVACFWLLPLFSSLFLLIFPALILLRKDESKKTVAFLRWSVFLLAAYASLMGYALMCVDKEGHELLMRVPHKNLTSEGTSGS